jgi:hypothetical protein
MKPLLTLLFVVSAALPGLAQDSSALINKALDEKVKLVLDKPLPEAMKIITEQTGVRLKENPVVWDLLPWGRETSIQLKAENVTLREALQLMAARVGLVIQLRGEFVEFEPSPALARLGQRASRDELRALDILASQPANLGTDRPTIKQLLEAVDLKLSQVQDISLAIENRIVDVVKQDRAVFVPRNATLMEALEAIPKETRGTWYPWGKNVVIVAKEDRTRQLLAKPLNMRGGAGGLDVMQVILDISTRTGVPIELQPGVIQALPADARTLRGADGRPPVLENVPAQQILDIVAATTGISFAVQDDKVVASASAAGSAVRERSIGILQLDDHLQVLLPASQVPADVQEYIRQKTAKEIARLRQKMEAEGFKGTTRPGN